MCATDFKMQLNEAKIVMIKRPTNNNNNNDSSNNWKKKVRTKTFDHGF